MEEAPPSTADEFRATLYFDAWPDLSEAALVEAWGREGYGCRREKADGVFEGFRGGTYVTVGTPRPVEVPRVPPCYPAVTLPDIDWARTFFVDPKAGYDDLRRATYQAEFQLRILTDKANPATAHNEIAATLLGIHQVAPMRAVTLHYLDMIVGQANLDDYLSYADSTIDEPIRVASMLALGTFVVQENATTTAWTTGLGYFGQLDLLVEEPRMDALTAMNTVFSLGHLIVQGRRYKAKEWLTTFDLRARFVSAERDGKPALRVLVSEFEPTRL